jgi:hypothetical protein
MNMEKKKKEYDYQDTIAEVQSMMLGNQMLGEHLKSR